jgi:hypothetical protein
MFGGQVGMEMGQRRSMVLRQIKQRSTCQNWEKLGTNLEGRNVVVGNKAEVNQGQIIQGF